MAGLQQGHAAHTGPSSSELLTIVDSLGKGLEQSYVVQLMSLITFTPLHLTKGRQQRPNDSTSLHLALPQG